MKIIFKENAFNGLQSLALLFFLILISTSLKANFIAGGSLSYRFLGGDQYEVNLNLLRDCSGDSASTTDTIILSSGSCSYSQAYVMNLIATAIITSPCDIPFITTCDGGTSKGFEVCQYSCLITLPQHCTDWIFSMSQCCRVSDITNIQNPALQNFYIEAGLNNFNQDNSTPEFKEPQINFKAGITRRVKPTWPDPDGDSLVYEIVGVNNAPNNPVAYSSGLSGNNPLTSNPPLFVDQYGCININSTDQNEYGVFGVRVDEYRNGNVIGFSTINYPVYSYSQASYYSNPEIFIGPTLNYTIEATQPFCIDVFTNDSDALDSVYLSWNNSIPNATFFTTFSNRPVGHFCWTPSVTDISLIPYTIVFTASDNDCPANGLSNISITITVSAYTGIDDNNFSNTLIVYPNPVSGNFKIMNVDLLESVSFSDIFGNSIDVKKNIFNQYDFSNCRNGIYFINGRTSKGKSFNGKIIKQ